MTTHPTAAADLGYGPEVVKAATLNVLLNYEKSARDTWRRMTRIKKADRSDAHVKTMQHWLGVADGLRWVAGLIRIRKALPDQLPDPTDNKAEKLLEAVERYEACIHGDEWPDMREEIIQAAGELVGINLGGPARDS